MKMSRGAWGGGFASPELGGGEESRVSIPDGDFPAVPTDFAWKEVMGLRLRLVRPRKAFFPSEPPKGWLVGLRATS